MATNRQIYEQRDNSDLKNRTVAALSKAAENIINERQSFSVEAASDTFTSTAHGYSNGDKVSFVGATLPSDIADTKTYYMIGATTDTFQVSLRLGGSALAITTDGNGYVGPENHKKRYEWATKILGRAQTTPEAESERSTLSMLQNATLQAAYTTDPTGDTALDNDIDFVAAALVNRLAETVDLL